VYAPDIVSYDLVPPIRHVGIAAYRRPWEETFVSFEGRIGYEVSDLHITAADEVVFSHSLNRMSGTTKNGQTTSMWVRWTACFRKLDGSWLITHEQVSVPIDMESGRASLDLEPT
jgi:ketosteroid isomerase-like protein